ncbi:hypothetical protein CYY_003789 [Polysphondylium violaceum]|uniref:Proteasome maturation factor UMP1 family protein n=1 Tax=Polysphondylium violaceum TaxID=133409 RepID=A0A8J4V5Q2_9MYCE|nr:hypothetical protein CYY_003789 [Polysphondylium violaceum]
MERVYKKDLELPQFTNSDSNVKSLVHPVQSITLDNGRTDARLKNFAVSNVFGKQVTMANDIEKQIYSQFKRLPTLQSSMIGLETVLGLDEDFDFEDFLADPMNSETPLPSLHSTMEVKLGMAMPKNMI